MNKPGVLCGANGAGPSNGIKPVITDAFPGRHVSLGGTVPTSRNP